MRIGKTWLVPSGLAAAKLAAAALIFGHAGLQAQPRGAYGAVLAAPIAAPRQDILGGTLWKCAGERCTAPADGSRPLLVCQRVARAFGPLARFTAPTGELSSADLSRCNGQN